MSHGQGRTASGRVVALDLLRGGIVALMALDHCRMLLYPDQLGHETWNHIPDYQGSWAMYLTRWITHLCASGFFLLMGMGVVLLHDSRRLRLSRPWRPRRILGHFGLRALLLLVLALTVMNPAYLDPIYREDGARVWVILTVIFALAVNLFLGSIFVLWAAYVDGWIHGFDWRGGIRSPGSGSSLYSIPTIEEDEEDEGEEQQDEEEGQGSPMSQARRRKERSDRWRQWWKCRISDGALYLLGVALLILTEYLTPSSDTLEKDISIPLTILFIPGGRGWYMCIYPFLPWLAFTLWGITYARVVRGMGKERCALFSLVLSLIYTLLFLLIRLVGSLGNGGGVGREGRPSDSVMLFFGPLKYPPSLAYATMTLGANHLILAILYLVSPVRDFSPLSRSRWVQVRYCVSRWAWKGLGEPLLAFGKSALFFYFFHLYLYWALPRLLRLAFPSNWYEPTAFYTLYATWILGLVILWPACRWFGKFKHSKAEDSYWRLF